MYLPTDIPLYPSFNFNITGTQDNIIMTDSNMNGKAANFQNQLNIYGDTAYVFLNNHYINYLNITLTTSTITLKNVTSPLKYISLQTGLYYDILNPQTNGYVLLDLDYNLGTAPCLLDD